MSYNHDEFDHTWDGLEPIQPDRGRSPFFWLAVGAVLLVAICLCAGGTFLVARELLITPTPPPPPLIPTEVGGVLVEENETPRPPTPLVLPTVTLAMIPTVTLPGQATEPPAVADDVTAIRMTVPPAIDGALAEWAGIPTYTSAFQVFTNSSWDGTDDLSAVWRLGWDENNLYIGVDVSDDAHVQTQTGNQIFRGDSVDMQFDTDRDGDFGDGLSPDDFQITFSPGDFSTLPESVARFQGTAGGQILDAPGGHNVALKAQRSASGYTLEAAVPWSDISLVPSEGLVIGMALNANDNDTPGTAVQEVMMSHVATRTLTNPAGWGTLTLR